MISTIFDWVALQFAGVWPIIWHFGVGGLLVALCAVGWYFSPIHKVDFIWAAVVVIVVMTSTSIGVSLGEKRTQAQWDTARIQTVKKATAARTGAVRYVARKPSRWLRARTDSYDCDRHGNPMCGVAGNLLPPKNR